MILLHSPEIKEIKPALFIMLPRDLTLGLQDKIKKTTCATSTGFFFFYTNREVPTPHWVNNSHAISGVHPVCHSGQGWRHTEQLRTSPVTTLTQLALFILHTTTGKAGGTLVFQDITHKQSYFQVKESHGSHSQSGTVLLRSLFCFTSPPSSSPCKHTCHELGNTIWAVSLPLPQPPPSQCLSEEICAAARSAAL